jgi:hypothetical protein
MTKREYPYWIKERHNPQLGVYYVPQGQMSKTAARRYEKSSLYGDNVMLRFDTEEEYQSKLEELKFLGKNVQV